MVAHSFLIFCLHRLKSIHGDGPPILLLGSMKHHGFIQLTHLTLLPQASIICTPIVHSHLASIILGFHHWLYQGAPFSKQQILWPSLFCVSGDVNARPWAQPSSFSKREYPGPSMEQGQIECLLVLRSISLSMPTSVRHSAPSSTVCHECSGPLPHPVFSRIIAGY